MGGSRIEVKMTRDSPAMMNTSTKLAARAQVSQSKAVKHNATSSGKPSSRSSPQMNSQYNQYPNNSEDSRRGSPSMVFSREADNGRGSGQKNSHYNQYVAEQFRAQSGSGNKKQRSNAKNGFFGGNVQQFQPLVSGDAPPNSQMPSLMRPTSCTPSSRGQTYARRYTPPQVSSTFFAGSKMEVAPSPTKLPPPPAHWLTSATPCNPALELTKEERCIGLTSGLKMLLKVQ